MIIPYNMEKSSKPPTSNSHGMAWKIVDGTSEYTGTWTWNLEKWELSTSQFLRS